MRELRIIHPDDFPDAPDCDGSCAAATGGGAPCLLHAGLCCPDDPLDIVMVHPDVFNDDLVDDLFVAAALTPAHRGWGWEPPLPDTCGVGGGGKEVPVSNVDAADVGYLDRGGGSNSSVDGAPWPPPPARAAAMSSDSSWTASSLETESSLPPPRRLPVCAPKSSDSTSNTSSLENEPPPVSRLVVVPRKKRDVSVKRRKRLWSLAGIPTSIPASSGIESSGGDGVEQDGHYRNKVIGGGGVRQCLPVANKVVGSGGVRQRLPVARPPRSRQTQRRCTHCDSTETPQWRAGPAGPGTLCNACGIRYTMNKLLPEYRPSTSPSFQSDKHSNRHRKVVKLREKKVKVDMIDTMTPAPYHVDKKVKVEMIDNMALAADRGDFEKKVKIMEKIDNMALALDHAGDFMDVCKYI